MPVTIFPNVVADFSFEPACEASEMQLTDESAFDPTSPIVDWFWNFENTLNSTDQNPITIFDRFGFQPVKLIITSQDGCKDTIRQNVTVYPKPEVDFTYLSTCARDETPFVANNFIIDTIANDIIESISWDFGDGTMIQNEDETNTCFLCGRNKECNTDCSFR